MDKMDKIDRFDILQEMVNIGFGSCSSAIADLFNVFVTMRVPRICDISASGVRDYLINEIGLMERVNVVRQIFR
jgi:chemotaxis protein CheY-P-specific phosphatase CheC